MYIRKPLIKFPPDEGSENLTEEPKFVSPPAGKEGRGAFGNRNRFLEARDGCKERSMLRRRQVDKYLMGSDRTQSPCPLRTCPLRIQVSSLWLVVFFLF